MLTFSLGVTNTYSIRCLILSSLETKARLGQKMELPGRGWCDRRRWGLDETEADDLPWQPKKKPAEKEASRLTYESLSFTIKSNSRMKLFVIYVTNVKRQGTLLQALSQSSDVLKALKATLCRWICVTVKFWCGSWVHHMRYPSLTL